VYVLDSVCKQARETQGKSGDVFSPRFAIRIKDTLSNLKEIPKEDQVCLVKCLLQQFTQTSSFVVKALLRGILESWTKLELFPRESYFALLSTLPLGMAKEPTRVQVAEFLVPFDSITSYENISKLKSTAAGAATVQFVLIAP
jgi:hypothetical protein